MKEKCICGKKVYGSMAVAAEEATDYERLNPGHNMGPYECLKVPGNFHIGHNTQFSSGTLYSIPHTSLVVLRMPRTNYLVAGKTRVPLDAKVVNEMINQKNAIILAKSVGPGKWDCVSPGTSEKIHSFKYKTLLIEAWASAKIPDKRARAAWIKRTHDYLAAEFRAVTADMVNEFIGYDECADVPAGVEVKEQFPFYMSTYCLCASKDGGATQYSYHTSSDCYALKRGSHGAVTGLTEEDLSRIPQRRRKICSICAGTNRKVGKKAKPAPEQPVSTQSVDVTEISIGGEVYVQKSSIAPPKVERIKPVSVTIHSHVFSTEDELGAWARSIDLQPGDIVALINMNYPK